MSVTQLSSLEAPGSKMKNVSPVKCDLSLVDSAHVSCLTFICKACQLRFHHRWSWASPCTDSCACYVSFCLLPAVERAQPREAGSENKVQPFLWERRRNDGCERQRKPTSTDLFWWLEIRLVLDWTVLVLCPEFPAEKNQWTLHSTFQVSQVIHSKRDHILQREWTQ